jgi:hypothetical protein
VSFSAVSRRALFTYSTTSIAAARSAVEISDSGCVETIMTPRCGRDT